MKSTIKKHTWQEIYRLLDEATPLEGDCGQLCQAACCTDEHDEMIIYLLPGEEKMFTKKEDWLIWAYDKAEDYDFPASWHGKVYYVQCLAAPHCPRTKRPLQCRFFPLAPHLTPDGQLRLIYYAEALPYTCPLIAEMRELSPRFIHAVRRCWQMLLEDPLIYDLVYYDSRQRQEDQLKIVI